MASMAPMLATAGPPPSGSGWSWDMKFDGQRCVARVASGEVLLLSRNLSPITSTYPEITAALVNASGGRDVVVDAVNDSEEARQTWRGAASRANTRLEFVHLTISDALEHEQRLSGRDRGLAHVGEPTWPDVQHRRAGYAEWSDEVAEFDTTGRTADEIADALAAHLGTTFE